MNAIEHVGCWQWNVIFWHQEKYDVETGTNLRKRSDLGEEIEIHKVNRCLVRYSPRATTTHRPTNRAPNKPAWPKLTKNANFGPNLVVFGQKILFFTGEIKSFVTYITENPPRHLVHIVFWSALDNMCKKWQYLAQNDQKCRFWTKFGRFWAKNPNFYGSK